jgi:heme-degrading monooxygenase HmoA
MAHIHIAATPGVTIDGFRAVAAKHNPPQDIDGLLAWAAGTDENSLNVVSIWQSQAHQERFAAEQLFPAFQALGVADEVMANGEFTTYEVGELYIR